MYAPIAVKCLMVVSRPNKVIFSVMFLLLYIIVLQLIILHTTCDVKEVQVKGTYFDGKNSVIKNK